MSYDWDKDFQQGLQWKKAGDYQAAYEIFYALCQRKPTVPQYWHCAGHMQVLLKNREKANELLAQAIAHYDDLDSEECFWIGACYALQQDRENALAHLRRAIQMDNFFNTYRLQAAKEEDYRALADDPEFRALTRKRNDEQINQEYCAHHLARFEALRANLVEIPAEAFSFYLAAPFAINLHLCQPAPLDVEQALREVGNHNDWEIKIGDDRRALEIWASSDMWQPEGFERLAPFLEEGAYLLLVDDEDCYWKVLYAGGVLHYYRAEPESSAE